MSFPGLESVPACPWCGGANRRAATSFSNEPNRYVSAVAAKIGIPVEKLLEGISVFECTTCGTSYCDPWLSTEMRRWLFTQGQSQHYAGWFSFFERLQRSDTFEKSTFPRSQQIWRHLVARIGPVHSYAEVACPFMGLLGYFQTVRQPDPSASFATFESTCAQQATCGQLPTFLRRVPTLRRSALAYKGRRLASQWKRNPPASASVAAADVGIIPANLTYLWAHTTLAWQDNCQSVGVTCAGMAAANYGVALADIWKTEQRYDVIGFFNTLDHQDEPLRVLERALSRARFVVLELHEEDEVGKQHLFAMNHSLQNTARARGWFFEEFSASVTADYFGAHDRLYLVSLDRSIARAS